jgi:hypothetical protein
MCPSVPSPKYKRTNAFAPNNTHNLLITLSVILPSQNLLTILRITESREKHVPHMSQRLRILAVHNINIPQSINIIVMLVLSQSDLRPMRINTTYRPLTKLRENDAGTHAVRM